MMEVNIFPSPAVAGPLSRGFVEARLHTDAYDPEREKEIHELQLELEGGVGLPYYLVLDPDTEEILGTFNRSAKAIVDSGVFVDFLEAARERHEFRLAAR